MRLTKRIKVPVRDLETVFLVTTIVLAVIAIALVMIRIFFA
jgi:hypothetical protein